MWNQKGSQIQKLNCVEIITRLWKQKQGTLKELKVVKNLKIGSMIRRSSIVIVAVLASTLTIICGGLVFFVHIALMRVWVHGFVLKSDICDFEVSEHIGRDASTSVCVLL